MAIVKVKCPYCGSEEVVLYGKSSTGKQRYLCQNKECKHKTFQLAFTFGTREHKNLDELLGLLKPFPIGKVFADHNFAYEKRIPSHQLVSGKKEYTENRKGSSDSAYTHQTALP